MLEALKLFWSQDRDSHRRRLTVSLLNQFYVDLTICFGSSKSNFRRQPIFIFVLLYQRFLNDVYSNDIPRAFGRESGPPVGMRRFFTLPSSLSLHLCFIGRGAGGTPWRGHQFITEQHRDTQDRQLT
ncbi:hypothetical protein XENOCAPTIV_022907 [Xenoophorus captivus]|uniref:Uncharacterized protein n=1 Tax=Xenoophorus captivus TaxID=1517983 RepID=A0ABV0R4H5_9TELE